MFTTYVIENLKGSKYTGSTNNVEERIEMRNNGDISEAKFHRTTYKKGPWKLIFKQDFKTRWEAMKFEKFLKTGKGREWLERARLGG
jgi:putative endonuclease